MDTNFDAAGEADGDKSPPCARESGLRRLSVEVVWIRVLRSCHRLGLVLVQKTMALII
jgi:hypothetical protein